MYKSQIEGYILNACIFCNGYPEIAHILTENNFDDSGQISNRAIFKCFQNLYPQQPIDLITVTTYLNKIHNLQSINIYFDNNILNNKVSCSSNIKYWAIILVQECIREALIKKLFEWRDRNAFNEDKVSVEIINEILETIQINANDVFEVIDKAIIYFNHVRMIDEYNECLNFKASISDRIAEIKKVNSITKALGYVLEISNNTNSEIQYQCQQFSKVIADLVISGRTNPQYTNALNVIMGYGV